MSNLSQQLHISLGVADFQLERLIQRAPNTYKTYTIPKRSGGFRIIAQPARETKLIQNWLISNIFCNLVIHDRATAYRTGASIAKNAEIHKKNSYISKFDFKDFFGSISYAALLKYLVGELASRFSLGDLERMARVSCIKHPDRRDMCLSIGAPSSPLLSNAIMRKFDEDMHSWSISMNIEYSRYADDITFSTNSKGLSAVIQEKITSVVAGLSEVQLELNERKTAHVSKKHQRRITGLIINNDDNISLGRERKREISSLIHKFLHNRLPDDEIFRLQGLLGFAADVERSFIVSMNNKYGNQVLSELFKRRTEKLGTELGLWVGGPG